MHEAARRRPAARARAASFVLALSASATLAVPSSALGTQDPRPVPSAVLEVPYLPQSPDLCGGAAVAMVFRYWGARGVSAEDFAPLVRADAAGIPTGVLTDAARSRGWSAFPFTGTRETVTHHLARGRPVIALVEVARNRFHYVVVLAWHDDVVVLHDPAIAPSRTVRADEFAEAWAASGRWSLLLLPGEAAGRATADGAPDAARDEREPAAEIVPPACADAVHQGVQHAAAGRLDDARAALDDARASCPDSSIPLRERAGVALIERQFAEAASLASEAVAVDPSDAHAWRVLATSRFLLRDRAGALDAWNAVAEPRVDLVRIEGLARTRFRVVGDVLGVAPGRVLTNEALARAERRAASLPTVMAARVGYRPVAGGLAEVDAAIVERPVAVTAVPHVAATAVRALVEREVTYTVASPLGAGDAWDLRWRFWEARPAVSGGLQKPLAAGPLRGVLGITGGWEAQEYARGEFGGAIVRESRRTMRASLGDWASSRLRWDVSAGLDRWDDAGTHAAIGGSLDLRLADDHVAASGSLQQWLGGSGFTTTAVSARWRSNRSPGTAASIASGTFAFASPGAPLDLWEGAGTGHGRRLLLRAHPLLERGVVTGAVFGRRVAHLTVERRQPLAAIGPLRVAVAGFADAARHWDGLRPGRAHLDAGVGARVHVPGEGLLRIDLARGVADGAVALSAGWQRSW